MEIHSKLQASIPSLSITSVIPTYRLHIGLHRYVYLKTRPIAFGTVCFTAFDLASDEGSFNGAEAAVLSGANWELTNIMTTGCP